MPAEFYSPEHSQAHEIPNIDFGDLIQDNNNAFPDYSIAGIPIKNRIVHFVEGDKFEGSHPNSELNDAIEEYISNKQAEQVEFVTAIDDMPDVNHRYADLLDEARELSSAKEDIPIKIVDEESFQRLSEFGRSNIEGLEGFRDFGRIVLKENLEKTERYGDAFLLHKIIHETHHDSKAPGYNLIHTSTFENPESGVLDTVITPVFNGVGDFITVEITEEGFKCKGIFFEETYAEIKTVMDMARRKKVDDCHHAIGIQGESVSIIDEYDNEEDLSYVIPMRFAMAHNHRREDLATEFGDYCWASYSLHQLVEQSPGIIDDMTLARENPDHYQEVVRKINGIRPGLYEELNSLSLSDFKKAIKLTDPRRA